MPLTGALILCSAFDESVELNDLSLDLLTSLLEKKPSLSPLFAENSSQESEEGR